MRRTDWVPGKRAEQITRAFDWLRIFNKRANAEEDMWGIGSDYIGNLDTFANEAAAAKEKIEANGGKAEVI